MHKYTSSKVVLHTPTCSIKDFKHSELNFAKQQRLPLVNSIVKIALQLLKS